VIVLIQLVASLFGFEIDLSDISGKLVAIVDAVFVILAILGIVVDPTTKGFGDTKLVQGYTEPRDEGVTRVEEVLSADEVNKILEENENG
jgi:phi LC3 family holin